MAGDLGLVGHALPAGDTAAAAITELTGGRGCEASIDCSGSGAAPVFALENTRAWGRCAFAGEGGRAAFAVSELLVHKQMTLHGSWVTSLRHMEKLLEHLLRWNLHPERIVTHRYPLGQADAAAASPVVAPRARSALCSGNQRPATARPRFARHPRGRAGLRPQP